MKKIVSFAMFLILVLASVAIIPAGAATPITLNSNRTPPTDVATTYNDLTTTNYVPGYVLHYMDFSKVTSFESTKYFVAKNDDAPAAEAFELTDDGALKIANNSSNKCFVLLTGNQIPKNIQNYSVDISFKFNNTSATTGNYFGYVMSATLGSDGKYSSLVDQCIRWQTGGLDNCECTSAKDTVNAITSDMQSGMRVDFHYEAVGRTCEQITVSCNGNTATYIRNQKAIAAEGSYMGFFVGKNDSVNIYTIRVTAGVPSQYTELTWPSSENALVQSVTSSAVSNEVIDESEKLATDREVPTEPALSYEDKTDTYYNPGYVLHHMDFTKVESFEETGYFVTNNTEPKRFSLTDDGYLNVQAQNAYGVNIMFTGNGIPKNIQDYTVRITFRHTSETFSFGYFGLIQSATLDTETGMISDSVESTIRYQLREKQDGYEPLIDQSSYVGEEDTLTAFVAAMQSGEWVTLEYSAMERNTMSITLTCGGNTVIFIKNKNTEAAADSFMGMLIGKGTNVEIHTVTVIAGYAESYESIIWPAEENALVQTVAAAAVGTAPVKDTDDDDSDGTDDDSKETTASSDEAAPKSDAEIVDDKGCGGSISAVGAVFIVLAAALASISFKRRKVNEQK